MPKQGPNHPWNLRQRHGRDDRERLTRDAAKRKDGYTTHYVTAPMAGRGQALADPRNGIKRFPER